MNHLTSAWVSNNRILFCCYCFSTGTRRVVQKLDNVKAGLLVGKLYKIFVCTDDKDLTSESDEELIALFSAAAIKLSKRVSESI